MLRSTTNLNNVPRAQVKAKDTAGMNTLRYSAAIILVSVAIVVLTYLLIVS
jgi:hypothetical protein